MLIGTPVFDRAHGVARRALITAVFSISLGTGVISCLPTDALPGDQPPNADATRREPFVETIPGTLVKFTMVPIPPGAITVQVPAKNAAGQKTGQMTSQVVQVKPLWVGKMEVTWDEYDVFLFRLDLPEAERQAGVEAKSRPSKPYGAPDRGFGHQGYPALGISFYAAQEYCKWLSKKTGKKYRLPTTAEWEYLCRAGEKITYPLSAEALDKVAWYWDNADDKAHEVGAKTPNAWGLHDTLGNVAEWCVDPEGVGYICGGHFMDKREQVHPQAREKNTPDWNATDPQNPKSKWWLKDGPFVGFRVVCEG
jgi:formylglycine-generating enzyme required for sulfatase activity